MYSHPLDDRSLRTSTHKLFDELFDELFPIQRSITGPGLMKSLEIVSQHMPLAVTMVPSGTRVFDWTVPPEWHLKSATLTHESGLVIANLTDSNLHVVGYSTPVDATLTREDLDKHLHSLPDLPDAIPYAISYYKPTWGFSIKDRVRRSLPPGKYRAIIDSEFVSGGVPIADCVLPGETKGEVLLTSYLCHPSMANNELSGPLVLLGLYRLIKAWPRRRFTYRFILNPETIGSLCYLYRHGDHLRRHMVGGLVLTCLGGPAPDVTYQLSRREDSVIDQVIKNLAAHKAMRVRKFDAADGSDERQYCSPGFNLPMGQAARTLYSEYEGYHNSLDDKAFMSIERLVQSTEEIERTLRAVEIGGYFRNLSPYGEPQLGPRGLYPTINVASTWGNSADSLMDSRVFLRGILTSLNYADGHHSMVDVANMMNMSIEDLRPVIERLENADLLRLEPFRDVS